MPFRKNKHLAFQKKYDIFQQLIFISYAEEVDTGRTSRSVGQRVSRQRRSRQDKTHVSKFVKYTMFFLNFFIMLLGSFIIGIGGYAIHAG